MSEYCPICGAATDEYLVATQQRFSWEVQHRCNPKTLANIDAALNVQERAPRPPSRSERFETGFLIHSLAGDPDV